MKNFSTIFTQVLRKHNVSRKELSQASGVSQSSISEYCRGNRTPEMGRLQSLVRALVGIGKRQAAIDLIQATTGVYLKQLDRPQTSFKDALEVLTTDYNISYYLIAKGMEITSTAAYKWSTGAQPKYSSFIRILAAVEAANPTAKIRLVALLFGGVPT